MSMLDRRNALVSLLGLSTAGFAKLANAAPRTESPDSLHDEDRHAGGRKDATETRPGIVSIDEQTFGGTKTFADGLAIKSGQTLKQTQGGTPDRPATENPLRFQPLDPAKGAFGAWYSGNLFNSTVDATCSWGYNCTGENGTEPRISITIEQDFEGTPGVHSTEAHFAQIYLPALGIGIRPFSTNTFTETGVTNVGSEVNGGGYYYLCEADSGRQLLTIDATGGARFVGNGIYVQQITNDNPGLLSATRYNDTGGAGMGAVGYWSAMAAMQVTAVTGVPIWFGRMDANGQGRKDVIVIDGATKGVQLFGTGGGANGSTDLGGGDGVLGIHNCTEAPTSDPTNGGVLFVEQGALKYRGSSGTVSTLAPA